MIQNLHVAQRPLLASVFVFIFAVSTGDFSSPAKLVLFVAGPLRVGGRVRRASNPMVVVLVDATQPSITTSSAPIQALARIEPSQAWHLLNRPRIVSPHTLCP